MVAVDVFTFGLSSLVLLPLDDLEKTVEEFCTDGGLASVRGWTRDRQAGDASRIVGPL